MDYQALQSKREQYRQIKGSVPQETAESFERAFEISYTHNSTALKAIR